MEIIMEKLEMVDLKNQYLNIKSEIDEAIQDCINTTAFIKGSQLKEFENELARYLNVKHVICCANGTDALQMAIMALDLKPGDEVILPAFTYIAAIEVVALLGLKPILIDVDPHTFNIEKKQVEAAITPKTKLVIPVHLFGQCADMEGIANLCHEKGLYIIEDAAQAIGSSYTFSNGTSYTAGTIGDIGTTSFFPSKNLGCFGDGGAIYTNNDILATKLRMIGNHGQSKKYFHEVVGINSRLDTIQAAILSVKLKYLEAYTFKRITAAAFYDLALKDVEAIETPFQLAKSSHVYHQYTLKVPIASRDTFKDYLFKKGIPSMIYYPLPVNEQEAYENICSVTGNIPNTKALCSQVISIPMHTELSESQLYYISETIRAFFKKG